MLKDTPSATPETRDPFAKAGDPDQIAKDLSNKMPPLHPGGSVVRWVLANPFIRN